MVDQTMVMVTESSQVGEARRTAARMGEAAGLNETARGKIAIAVTELANNLVRYAREGRLFFQIHRESRGGPFLELISVDRGPGMADTNRCMEDGFSTGGTPGNGLGAVRRLSDEFDIDSTPAAGTVILSRIGAGPHGRLETKRHFHWGTMSVSSAAGNRLRRQLAHPRARCGTSGDDCGRLGNGPLTLFEVALATASWGI